MFYVNLLTETRCRKPKLLGPEDLPDPKDEFRPMKDMNGKKYYLNPATGDDTYPFDNIESTRHVPHAPMRDRGLLAMRPRLFQAEPTTRVCMLTQAKCLACPRGKRHASCSVRSGVA